MPVDRNQRVMEMVEKELRENPNVSNAELQEKASEIDPRIGELSPRSFNARYPLQVKRKLSKEKSEESASETGSDDARAEVRTVLLDFARDFVGAEDRGKAIDVLMNVGEYVDRVVEPI